MNFHYWQSPCTHAIAACRWAEKDPYKYFWVYYKVRIYRDTYSIFLKPFSTQDLPSSDSVHPPVIQRQRGRPKAKRIRKGDFKKNLKICGTCSKQGHNKRTCRNQPVANGRQQRARDRVSTAPSDSEEDLQQDEIAEEIEDDEDFDDDEILATNRQFQTEIEFLEQRIAQHEAWKSNEITKILEQRGAEAVSQKPIRSDGEEEEEDSILSTVSSARYEGLEEDWWKEKGDSEVIKDGGQDKGNCEVIQGVGIEGGKGGEVTAAMTLRSRKRKERVVE
jgi:hypothetical protein